MQGTFDLWLVEENPLAQHYAVANIDFVAGWPGARTYKVRGRGRYEVGGEVAVRQDMFLELRIDNDFTIRLAYFTNDSPTVERLWPMLKLHLDETNQPPSQFYRLDLVAAPLRQIWFSTVNGMTPASGKPPGNHISAGDLISSAGHVIRSHQELTRNLGFMPSPEPPDLGLDAVDVLSSGEIVFSLEQDALSENLGPLHHGDLLSERGRVVARNQDLTRAFSIMPPVPDLGLDAVHVGDRGEIFFSIETPIFSGKAGMLGRGDLLSSLGTIVRNNAQLLANFRPPPSLGLLPHDYGLDAVHVWPSGEVWFSLEEGFEDARLGPIREGDLLSDQGYVVYANLDLVAPFSPLEDLADFGLDALYLFSGISPRLELARSGAGLVIRWDAPLGILQEASVITGPWRDVLPVGFPSPYAVPSLSGASFFRLREP